MTWACAGARRPYHRKSGGTAPHTTPTHSTLHTFHPYFILRLTQTQTQTQRHSRDSQLTDSETRDTETRDTETRDTETRDTETRDQEKETERQRQSDFPHTLPTTTTTTHHAQYHQPPSTRTLRTHRTPHTARRGHTQKNAFCFFF